MRSLLYILLLVFLIAVRPVARGQIFETLFVDNQGRKPVASLVQGRDGNFYGTTEFGGANDDGTVFKLTPAGELTTLASFSNSGVGSNPRAGLVEGRDGNFYGTTGSDTIFKVTPTGELTTLVSLDWANGGSPSADLVQGLDGNLYGTTFLGGARLLGTVFKVTPRGELTTLVHFDGTNGSNPHGALVQGNDGNFYGTTKGGGGGGDGTVFRMTPSGQLTTLVHFNWTNGAYPLAGLVKGSDGNFYGTTSDGGAGSSGTVFKVTPGGVFTTLASVKINGDNGRELSAPLVEGIDGNFYGTASEGGMNSNGNVVGNGTIFKVTPTGVLTTFVYFAGPDGSCPLAGLVKGIDGNLYGTTSTGGATGNGTIFKVTPTGVLSTLFSFGATVGSNPRAKLVEGDDGDFYGTTELGGASGNGTVFKVTRGGAVSTLTSFNIGNGSNPHAGLLKGGDGNFYGTTSKGGANNHGTIFKMTPSGELTTLTSFTGINGSKSSGGLVKGRDGNFYGTTAEGGAGSTANVFGDGTVFRMTPSGQLTTLVSFDRMTGSNPLGELVEGSDGDFYGTTRYGGTYGFGTVFKVTPAGKLTTLVSFSDSTGRLPAAGLVEGNDGNYYGTTESGTASNGYSTIFRVTPVGELTTLFTFNQTTGNNPRAGLVKGRDGNFYGVTSRGGTGYGGTIFKITPNGAFTRLHSFDGVNEALPEATPIFGSDGHLYGVASQMAIWRLFFISAPLVTTQAPSSITKTSAILSGTVKANGVDATVTFEYGLTPEYGSKVIATPSIASGTGATLVSAVLSGLVPYTTYYYRITASNSEGTTSSEAGIITTANNVPVATDDIFTPAANDFAAMTLPVLGNDSDADDDPLTITAITQGALGAVTTNGTQLTYIPGPGFFGRDTFSYTVSDGSGTATAQVELRANVPFTRTLVPSAITPTGSTLVGMVNANGSAVEVTFEYGLTPAYGNSIAAAPGTLTGTNAAEVRAKLTGLAPHTTYYYRITASNSQGNVATEVATFTTANSFPVATNDSFNTVPSEMGRATLRVLGNDSDADGDPLVIAAITQGSHGSVTTDGATLTYTPGPGFFGSDIFSYTISDGFNTTTAQVELRAAAPFVRLLSPSAVTTTGAVLVGAVNSNWADTVAIFEYGVTSNYGSTLVATPGTVPGRSESVVSSIISGLAPHTTYYYRLTASNSDGSTSTAGGNFTTANSPPVATSDSFAPVMDDIGAISLAVLGNDSDANEDKLTITSVTQGLFGSVTITGATLTYTPGPGFVGRDSFTYTVSDGIDTAIAQVELRASALFTRPLFAKDSGVPGAGQPGSGIPAGALFKSFGVPSINTAGRTAFCASYAAPWSAAELSVFISDPVAGMRTLVARRGQAAPGAQGALFAAFNDPLLDEVGDIAFLASLYGGDTTKANNRGLWVSSFSAESSSGTQLVARTGAQPPGVPVGARWKSFTSVTFAGEGTDATSDGHGWSLAFTAFMAPGAGGVSTANDMGLWIASPSKTVLALREGQTLQIGGTEKKLRSFAGLMSLFNVPGQGNGVTSTGAVAVQAFFTDGVQAILRVSGPGENDSVTIDALALPGDAVAGLGEAVAKFGIPVQSSSGTVTAWLGSLSGTSNPVAIFERNLSEPELLKLLARKGDSAPGIEGASFNAFRSVAVNDTGDALFLGKVSGRGISGSSDEGLWWKQGSGDNASLQLLAREGTQPPGVPEGARWSSFTSLALSEGPYGPLFTAKLVAGEKGKGLGKITSANDQGLWAVDSQGKLQLIAREGQEVSVEGSSTPKILKSFTVLSAVPGSPAQRRSFAGDGQIVYRALFTDGSQAVIKVQLP